MSWKDITSNPLTQGKLPAWVWRSGKSGLEIERLEVGDSIPPDVVNWQKAEDRPTPPMSLTPEQSEELEILNAWRSTTRENAGAKSKDVPSVFRAGYSAGRAVHLEDVH